MSELPLVSCLCVTRNRHEFLPKLIDCFLAQDYSRKELLIYDDTTERWGAELGLFGGDVHYIHGPELGYGSALHHLAQRAKGAVFAHFEDDDHYAPNYLSAMARELGEGDNDLVKLSGWFSVVTDEPKKSFWYWDTTRAASVYYKVGWGQIGVKIHESRPANEAENNDGYGWTYVYKKSALERVSYPDGFSGDGKWLCALRAAGGKIKTFPDVKGLALHRMHAGNSSCILPQYRLPVGLLSTLFPSFDAATSVAVGSVSVFAPVHTIDAPSGTPAISIIIPVVRPQNIDGLVASIKRNAGTDDYEIVWSEDVGRIGCPRMVKRLVEASRGAAVCFLGDDTDPEPGFLKIAYDIMVRDDVWLLAFNDSHSYRTVHWLASKKLLPYLKDGEFFWTKFYHNYCDDFLRVQAERIGKYRWLQDAKVAHHHPVFGTAKMDEHYERAMSDVQYAQDQQLFNSLTER